MGSVVDQMTIVTLKTEIDRLEQKNHFLERQVRELKLDIQAHEKREKELLEEIERLEAEQAYIKPYKSPFNGAPETVEDFLLPKLETGSGVNKTGVGLEEKWKDIMYAYTDEVFVSVNTPDLLLFRDDTEHCYRSPSNRTRLMFPIQNDDLLKFNIIKVRPATEEEITNIIKEYDL